MADDCVLVMEEGLREGQAFKDEVVITSATSSQTDKPPPGTPSVCTETHTDAQKENCQHAHQW